MLHLSAPGEFTGNKIGEFTGNTVREHTGNYVRELTGKSVREVTGNSVRKLTGNRLREAKATVAIGLSVGRDDPPRNEHEIAGAICRTPVGRGVRST